jgi:hypothetical protein
MARGLLLRGVRGNVLPQGLEMSETKRDQNLMLVYAVEGYSQRHNLPEKDVILLFQKHGISELIRKNYNALHTQDLDEAISFAEDILSWEKN